MPTLTNAASTADLEMSEHEDLYSVIIEGTFDGGSVDLRARTDANANYVTISDSATTVDKSYDILISFLDVQARITGGSGSESVNVTIKPINHR